MIHDSDIIYKALKYFSDTSGTPHARLNEDIAAARVILDQWPSIPDERLEMIARGLLELWQELRPERSDEWLSDERALAKAILAGVR